MKDRTWRVLSFTDSTVNRSQAMIEDVCDLMNWRQVSRFGPGRRFAAVMRRMLVAEMSMPIFCSSPWIRR
ncbi:MAG: hypothetical protein WAV54_13615 [Acidimicrobiales bacterium]